MLGIDDDTFATGKFAKVDAMLGPPKSKLDSPMEQSLSFQSFTDTRLDQQVGSSLLQHACANPLFYPFATRGFQNN
jgi:hypothetical protein